MKISKRSVKVKDLVEGYVDKRDEGVEGLGGNLDIRPPYQREFIYSDDKQQAVIDSVLSGFPLSIMYWVDLGNDRYEVLDGQQRTLSICKFISHDFSIKQGKNPQYFGGLTQDEQEIIMNYELDVYVCEGTEQEKLAWFERINVIGEPLTKQELRNSAYTGTWLSDAKKYFSKSSSPIDKYSKYLSGSKNRQAWLETVLKWASHAEYGEVNIEQYMADHKQDDDAKELWQYIFKVFNWVDFLFNYRKNMKGLDWGGLFNTYSQDTFKLNKDELEEEVSSLMTDESLESSKGIYYYIFTRDEKYLDIRAFTPRQKQIAYERQKGICPVCGDFYEIDEMHADHIIPFSKGGKTEQDNCQVLCRKDNLMKSNRY